MVNEGEGLPVEYLKALEARLEWQTCQFKA